MAGRRAAPPGAAERAPSKGELTRAALVATLVERVNAAPVDDIHISDICAANGLAVGAFYFHFGSKDAALEAIAVEGLEWLYGSILALPATPDLYAEITQIIATFHRGQTERGPLVRAVYRILAVRRVVRAAWLTLRGQVVDRLAARFEAERPAGAHGFQSSYLLAQFLLGAIERFFDDVYVAPPDGRMGSEGAPADVFVRQQADVWFRAATGRDSPASDPFIKMN